MPINNYDLEIEKMYHPENFDTGIDDDGSDEVEEIDPMTAVKDDDSDNEDEERTNDSMEYFNQ